MPRPPSAATVSLLRILDVAIWIRHSRSRATSRVRCDSGISDPRIQPSVTALGRAPIACQGERVLTAHTDIPPVLSC